MVPSMVQTFVAALDLEMAAKTLWVAGVRSSTSIRRFESASTGLGRLLRFFSRAILIGRDEILIMTWGGGLSSWSAWSPPATVALKGLKQASTTVVTCGTLGRSLAALAATNRFENCVIDTGAEASIVIGGLAGGDRKVQQAER